jgi:squalene-hopene/tetraprenyl-beta-curcumene cyclase
MVDPDRLSAAYETARCDLLAESSPAGHWSGELASSAFATAAAISALTLVERHAPTSRGRFVDEIRECRLSELIMTSVRWLARRQNADGGWSDTDGGLSSIATTWMVRAAFALTCVPADHPGLLEGADAYLKSQGGLRGLRRQFGRDRALLVPILANCALAGLVPWRKVPALPFERAAAGRRGRRIMGLPVTGYTVAALVALGQARYAHRKPWNPLKRRARRKSWERSLRALAESQPPSGGFLESAPLTSFVVMCLASSGSCEHAAVRKGLDFLLDTVRPDGSWPLAVDLATRNTTRAINALAAADEELGEPAGLDWLLSCQHRQPGDDAAGGWSWTDLAGTVVTIDDTAGALLALAAWSKSDVDARQHRIHAAALAAIRWLVETQNNDGSWPTFYSAPGSSAFGRGGPDITAHAIRALAAWRVTQVRVSHNALELRPELDQRISAAIERGFRYLHAAQHADGFWTPLWLGDPQRADRANPVIGTARVLAAFRDLQRGESPAAGRALEWLMTMKHADGSWGGEIGGDLTIAVRQASVEATAQAAEALLTCGQTPAHAAAAWHGIEWLIDAVAANRHHDSSALGICFARLWYREKLDALLMTTAALAQAARRMVPRPAASSAPQAVKTQS